LLLSDDVIILLDKNDNNLKMVSTLGQVLNNKDFSSYSIE